MCACALFDIQDFKNSIQNSWTLQFVSQLHVPYCCIHIQFYWIRLQNIEIDFPYKPTVSRQRSRQYLIIRNEPSPYRFVYWICIVRVCYLQYSRLYRGAFKTRKTRTEQDVPPIYFWGLVVYLGGLIKLKCLRLCCLLRIQREILIVWVEFFENVQERNQHWTESANQQLK